MIVGLDGAGKTHFQEYFVASLNNVPVEPILDMATMGVNTKTLHYDGREVTLWDIGARRHSGMYGNGISAIAMPSSIVLIHLTKQGLLSQ